MAINFYSNTDTIVAAGVAILEPISAGYTVSDDLQTTKSGSGTFITCAECGERTREFSFTNEDPVTAWNAFIAVFGACSFDMDGDDCAGGSDTISLTLGNGCGSTFSISADNTTIVQVNTTLGLINDPAFHT